MDSTSPQKERMATSHAAMMLIALAWSAPWREAVDQIREHSPKSDDSLRAELLCLRMYAINVACRAELKNEITAATFLSELRTVYASLTGAFEGTEPSDWSTLLEKFLEMLRVRHAEQYRAITELRALALSEKELKQRMDVYGEMAATDEEPEASTAFTFSAFCGTPDDPTICQVAMKDLDDMVAVATGFFGRIEL